MPPNESPRIPKAPPGLLEQLRNKRDCGRVVCAVNAWFLGRLNALLHCPADRIPAALGEAGKLLRTFPSPVSEGGKPLPVWQVASAHAVLDALEREGQAEALCERYLADDKALDKEQSHHDARDVTHTLITQGSSASGILSRSITGLLSQLRSQTAKLQAERFADHVALLRSVGAVQEEMLAGARDLLINLHPNEPGVIPTVIRMRSEFGHVLHIEQNGSRCMMSIPVLLGAMYKEQWSQGARSRPMEEFIQEAAPCQMERLIHSRTPDLLAGLEAGRLYLTAAKGKDYPPHTEETELIFDERHPPSLQTVLTQVTESESGEG